jgi:hypothetical protein
MGIYQKMTNLSAAFVGASIGRFVAPPIVAPVARAAANTTMNFMWGKPAGFFGAFVRKVAVEHIGNQAFAYAGPIGSTVGGIAAVISAQGTYTLASYANHVYKNKCFLNGVTAAGANGNGADMLSFEMDKAEGFKLD